MEFLNKLKSIHTLEGVPILTQEPVRCMSCNCYSDIQIDYQICSCCHAMTCNWCTFKTIHGQTVCEKCLDNQGE